MSTPVINPDALEIYPPDAELSDFALDLLAELLVDYALNEEQDK